jgi:hypothetical protein
MEAVIVIHRSTRKCAEHLSQHNLQKEKKPKHKLLIITQKTQKYEQVMIHVT